MPKSSKLTPTEKDLIRRYLVWFYKADKEALDKIDRYFTQFSADNRILKNLKRSKEFKKRKDFLKYKSLVKGFEEYAGKKKANADLKKFSNPKTAALNEDYLFLKNRFQAIEEAIIFFLGRSELSTIRRLYEEEMTRRILSAREHT